MPSLSDVCSVFRDRLLLDLQPGGAHAAWMALQPQLKYAVGRQGAMDNAACTGKSDAWRKWHTVLTNQRKRKPYLAFKQLEEQVHSQLIGAAAAAGCGSSAADIFVAVPMQRDQSLKNYLIATARRNDPHYVTQTVHKAHASATDKARGAIQSAAERALKGAPRPAPRRPNHHLAVRHGTRPRQTPGPAGVRAHHAPCCPPKGGAHRRRGGIA